MTDRPFYVERNHVIVAAREACLAGVPWEDDGSVDAAVGRMVYEVMTGNPAEPVIGCIDAVVAMRSQPAGDLTDGQLEARVRLDLRLQSDKDREKKRVPSSQAEIERRSGKQAAIVARVDRVATLRAGLQEALGKWSEYVRACETNGDLAADHARIEELGKLLVDR